MKDNRQNKNNAVKFDMDTFEKKYCKRYGVDPLYIASLRGIDTNNTEAYLTFLIKCVGTEEEKRARKAELKQKPSVPLMTIAPIPDTGMTKQILDRFSCFPSMLHQRYADRMVEEWRENPDKFFTWVLQTMQTQKGNKIDAIDKTQPIGPENCRLSNKAKEQVEEDPFIQSVIEMAAPFKFNVQNKYKTLVSLRELDPEKWNYRDFCAWVQKQIEKGEMGPYLNRLDITKPYTPTNCYFSFRPRNGRSHGMSKTRLYSKWGYVTRNYKDMIDQPITLREFIDDAMSKNFHPNSRMRVRKNGPKITLQNVEFWSAEDYDDINRILGVFRAIPKEKNGFESIISFMDWTVRSGYCEFMDFKKVGRGKYSEKTCVWDIFTEEAYVASKGRRTYDIYQKKAANE